MRVRDGRRKNRAASFWREFIDRLARHRFNLVSLWNLHPFPSLVRVPEYPDVALADVQRSLTSWKEHYALQATGLDGPELLGNVETLKRLTIDEKIAFWHRQAPRRLLLPAIEVHRSLAALLRAPAFRNGRWC